MGNKLIPEGKWSRITLSWSFIQFVLISIMEFIIIILNNNDKKTLNKDQYLNNIKDEENGENVPGNYTALIVYQVLFIVALVYQLYLTVDTLLKFSTIDLISLAIFNSMCLVYSIIQHRQTKDIFEKINKSIGNEIVEDLNLHNNNTMILMKINIGMMVIFTIGWWYITFKLYKIFGWNVFKQIGADISLKERLKMFNVLVTLLKVTFFFINVLFLTQYCTVVLSDPNVSDEERTTKWYLQEFTIPVLGIICTAIGFLAMVKESRLLLGIYIFTLCAVMGFISSVYTELFHEQDKKNNKYDNFKNSLTATIMFTLVLCLTTYCVSLINFKNFGLGIPKSINKSKNKNTIQSTEAEKNQQKRLSID